MRNSGYRICLLFFWLLPVVIHAQHDIAVPLHRIEGVWPLWGLLTREVEEVPPSLVEIYGIPSAFKDSYRLWKLELHHLQALYEDYKIHNKPLNERQMAYLQSVDKQYLYNGVLRHDVFILTCVRDDKKFIIVDSDNDRNFSNNQVHEFHLSDMSLPWEQVKKIAPVFLLNYERYDGAKIIRQNTLLKLIPFVQNATTESVHAIRCDMNEHRAGAFSVGNTAYHVALTDGTFSGEYLNPYIRIVKANERYVGMINGIDVLPFRLSDQINFEGYVYQMDKVSLLGDTLYLRFMHKTSDDYTTGFNIGDCISKTSFQSMDGRVIHTNGDSSQYTVFNFWGSWCMPCVSEMPGYVAKISKVKGNIRFIGVAVDYSEGVAVRFANEHGMHWPQIYEYIWSDDPHSLRNLLRVDAFPTYIVVDANGKIILRASTDVRFVEFDRFLRGSIN